MGRTQFPMWRLLPACCLRPILQNPTLSTCRKLHFLKNFFWKIVKNRLFWLFLGPFWGQNGHFLSPVFTFETFFHDFEQFFTYNWRFDMFYANLMVMWCILIITIGRKMHNSKLYTSIFQNFVKFWVISASGPTVHPRKPIFRHLQCPFSSPELSHMVE